MPFDGEVRRLETQNEIELLATELLAFAQRWSGENRCLATPGEIVSAIAGVVGNPSFAIWVAISRRGRVAAVAIACIEQEYIAGALPGEVFSRIHWMEIDQKECQESGSVDDVVGCLLNEMKVNFDGLPFRYWTRGISGNGEAAPRRERKRFGKQGFIPKRVELGHP